MTTRLKDKVTGGAKMKVFRNATEFYIESGIDFVSNVLIPVRRAIDISRFVESNVIDLL